MIIAYPLPLSTSRPSSAIFRSLASLLLCIEHQAEHIETELWKLETHSLELMLGLVTQHMAPGGPECGHGLSDALIVDASLLIDETRVCDLALGRGLGQVDLLMRKCCKLGKAKFLCKCVDAGVSQQTDTIIVGRWHSWIVLEVGATLEAGEVIGLIQVLEDRSDRSLVVLLQFNAPTRGGIGEVCTGFGEEWRAFQKSLVGVEGGLGVAGADNELDDGGAHVAVETEVVNFHA